MDFLKKHGEKILFLILLATLGASAFLAMNAKSNLQRTVERSPNAGNVEMTMGTEKVGELISHLEGNPPHLEVVSNSFTPEVRVICMNPDDRTLIPKDAKICPYCDWVQEERVRDSDDDGIDDNQEAKWGMNPTDPTDVFLDQDNDGFNTKLEFELGFSPVDPQSHPPLVDYLRLENVVQSSIEFELRGIAKLNEAYTLQLWWKYPDEDQGTREYIKEGNRFGRNNEFLVESFTEKRPLIDGRYMDQSFALIKSGSRELKLFREGDNRKGMITESTATLKLMMGPDWEKEVRVNETIELDKKTYIIVDINRQVVVIKPDVDEPDSANPISIRRATPEELEALKPKELEMNLDMPLDAPPIDAPNFF